MDSHDEHGHGAVGFADWPPEPRFEGVVRLVVDDTPWSASPRRRSTASPAAGRTCSTTQRFPRSRLTPREEQALRLVGRPDGRGDRAVLGVAVNR